MAKKSKSVADTELLGESTVDPKRILVVDDDPEIIDALRYALQAKGYQVLIARDGNQGLAMAERESPDLIIFDAATVYPFGLL